MESTQELIITESRNIERKKAILDWLNSTCGIHSTSLQLMAGDASLRRYFRLVTEEHTFVVMDAPPPHENCIPYIAISKTLRQMGLHAPAVIYADVARGFLLITDFGDATYLSALTSANVEQLYGEALDALAILQTTRVVEGHPIPAFTADFMRKEWVLHKEWVLCKLLGLSLPLAEKELDACYEIIVESAVTQPQVFMHRDYHSANLMVLPQGGVGILDFQDAFIGPVTYDLVSLLRDCYIDWPKERVQTWASLYLQRLQDSGELLYVNEQTFLRWFDLMGVQRHLKALMTFARKEVRDHQPRYLRYIPRTLEYLIQVSHQYPELAALHDYLRITVQPAFERIMK
jgi:aminoglycoside/choline kinase family phosphotransferase